MSSTSLNRNRELGLITSDDKVMSSIAKTFAADFRNGKHWSYGLLAATGRPAGPHTITVCCGDYSGPGESPCELARRR